MVEMQTTPSRRPGCLRYVFITILLVLVLLGVDMLYDRLEDSQPVLRGEAGDLLYIATFDGFTEEWEQYEGRLSARIDDSRMVIRVDQAGDTAYSAAEPQFADFDVRVNATAIDGPIDNGFGLLFRLQSGSTGCDMPLRILCDLAGIDLFAIPLRLLFRPENSSTEGFYMFLISSDGYYSLWRGQAGNDEQVSAWIASDAIRTDLNQTNEIRVIGAGNEFQFYINDTLVELCLADPGGVSTYSLGECIGGEMYTSYQDSSFATGQIAVVAHSTQNGGEGVVIAFDNLVVFSPPVIPLSENGNV